MARIAPGARIGPYEIISFIAAGGMGEVYRARDPRLARPVAIKVLPEETFGDAEAVLRFEREARAAAAVAHPNLICHCRPEKGAQGRAVGSFGDRIAGRKLHPRRRSRSRRSDARSPVRASVRATPAPGTVVLPLRAGGFRARRGGLRSHDRAALSRGGVLLHMAVVVRALSRLGARPHAPREAASPRSIARQSVTPAPGARSPARGTRPRCGGSALRRR